MEIMVFSRTIIFLNRYARGATPRLVKKKPMKMYLARDVSSGVLKKSAIKGEQKNNMM